MQNEILRHEGDNIGSVIELFVAPANGIESIAPVTSGAIHHAVVFKSNNTWLKLYCVEKTLSYREDQAESDQGSYFKKKLVGKIPKDRAEVIDILNGMKNNKYVLLYKDANGLKKLVGIPDEPMYFKSSFDTKADVPQRNEYDIVFEGDGVDKSPVYNL